MVGCLIAYLSDSALSDEAAGWFDMMKLSSSNGLYMLSSMQTGVWGGRMSCMSIRCPMTPVCIPNIIFVEESMQSPNEVYSKCSQVMLHSGIALMNHLRIDVLYCSGS